MGDHPITVTGEANQGNYYVVFVNGILTINDATAPLHNVARVDAKGANGNGWYRLATTNPGPLTEKTLEQYETEIKNGKDIGLGKNQYNASLVAGYDFSDIEIEIAGYKYVYKTAAEAETLEGTLDFYTVQENGIYVSKKIITADDKDNRGWMPGVTPNDDTDNDTLCFVRKFTITLHHELVEQKLPNFLAIDGMKNPDHTTKDYYRLNVGTIKAPLAEKYPNSYNQLEPGQYEIPGGEYSFSGCCV